MIFALSVIATEMLLGFNTPVFSDKPEQLVGVGFLAGMAGDSEVKVVGRLDHATFAHVIHGAFDSEDLLCSGQADGRPIHHHAAQLSILNPPVAFVGGLSLRGE